MVSTRCDCHHSMSQAQHLAAEKGPPAQDPLAHNVALTSLAQLVALRRVMAEVV